MVHLFLNMLIFLEGVVVIIALLCDVCLAAANSSGTMSVPAATRKPRL